MILSMISLVAKAIGDFLIYQMAFLSHLIVAGLTRLELATSGVTGRRSNQLNYNPAIFICGRRNRARTCDPRLVRPVLSQLSYPPKRLWTSAESMLEYINADRILSSDFPTMTNLFFITRSNHKKSFQDYPQPHGKQLTIGDLHYKILF